MSGLPFGGYKERADGWYNQDNDLPSLQKSDKAKDIPNFLQAARAFCDRSGVF
jgi:hypothetical protein